MPNLIRLLPMRHACLVYHLSHIYLIYASPVLYLIQASPMLHICLTLFIYDLCVTLSISCLCIISIPLSKALSVHMRFKKNWRKMLRISSCSNIFFCYLRFIFSMIDVRFFYVLSYLSLIYASCMPYFIFRLSVFHLRLILY